MLILLAVFPVEIFQRDLSLGHALVLLDVPQMSTHSAVEALNEQALLGRALSMTTAWTLALTPARHD